MPDFAISSVRAVGVVGGCIAIVVGGGCCELLLLIEADSLLDLRFDSHARAGLLKVVAGSRIAFIESMKR